MIKKAIGCYANGRLGSLVMSDLLSKGYEVDLLVRNPGSKRVQELRSKGANIIPFDFEDFSSLEGLVSGNCSLYVGGPFGDFSGLIDWVKENESRIERAVFISSANAKAGDYESYRKFEEYEDQILQSLSKGIIIKPTLIFGIPDDGNFGFIASWLVRFPVFPIVGSGKTLYQPVHYEDLKNAIVAGLLEPEIQSRSFLIGGRDRISYEAIVKHIRKLLQARCLTIPIPKNLMLCISYAVGSFVKLPLTREQIRRVDVDRDVDIEDAIKELDYDPAPFAERLEEAVEIYRKHFLEGNEIPTVNHGI